MAEPLLKKVSTGEAVRPLQRALKDLGYDSGEVDGDFGGAHTGRQSRRCERRSGCA